MVRSDGSSARRRERAGPPFGQGEQIRRRELQLRVDGKDDDGEGAVESTISVLKTRAASTPSSLAASSPYDDVPGTWWCQATRVDAQPPPP
ncbi:MAG: hypothetical protein ACR2HI_04165 [Gaiella sp.]